MALQKSITLPNGVTGNYIRIGAHLWDRSTKEASCRLFLFTSAAYAASRPDQPLCLLAVIRLRGAKFDHYLSNTALAGQGVTVLGQCYAAAKAEPLLPGGGLSRAELSLADAVDV